MKIINDQDNQYIVLTVAEVRQAVANYAHEVFPDERFATNEIIVQNLAGQTLIPLEC